MRKIFSLERMLIFSVFLLTLVGIISIYSSSLSEKNFLNFKKQIIFFIVGIILMIIFSFIDHKIFMSNSLIVLILYILSFLFLILLYFFGAKIRGSRGWFKIGFFSFQPIEFAKIALLIFLARFFSRRSVVIYKLKHILLSAFYVFVLILPVIFQPDLGGAIILILVWLSILFFSGIRLKHFLILFFLFLIIFSIGWNLFLKDYQKARIVNFFYRSDPLGMGWSQEQAKIALGSGGFLGKGFGKGTQIHYYFLTDPQTDFIFSAIGEEFGFLGLCFIFSIYSFIFYILMRFILEAKSNFSRLLLIGILTIWFSEFFINIGMNMQLLPVIGITLPFVSYGGSSLISNYLLLGLILNIRKDRI